MKNFKIVFLLLMAVSVSSQQLDEEFLESLPDDVREDIQKRQQQKVDGTAEQYRPYVYSSKLSQVETFLKLKDRLEADLLELERRISNDEIDVSSDLKVYGLDFFNTFQTTFMPINEPNPDSGYMLDVGDILEIQLVGPNEYIEELLVNSDGSVTIPDIGKVVVAGLSLNDASLLIKSKVNSVLIGNEVFISLSEIRDVNILVTGNSENPGIYTLTGNSNILHALSAAGGISEFGSLREINLIRDNIIIETLDVYDLLIEGKYNLKKRLRSGDVVFVEARKNIITIDGAVNRPAMYEALDNQKLISIINYANDITRNADRENISLERIVDGSLKTIPVPNDSYFEAVNVEDGDLIYIREYPFRQAKISGAVLKPGTYMMAAGDTINDLVKKAGGYTANAYQFGAVYLNEDAKKVNELSKEILYQEFLDNIIALSQQNIGGNIDLTPIVKLTEEIKNTEANGRVVIDLLNDSTIDLYNVKEGDELFVPETNNVVYVYGEISSEGAVMFSENKGVEYFVDKSGGFKKFADNESIYILHPNGESQLYRSKRNIFETSPKSEMKIYPGSIIFVPRALDDSAPRRIATQAYVSILGNLGIALASLSAINE
jgi:protein involved in polysaccharide export with SLBB domain|tara:strand:+ start:502 stop:2316 length:1815 start_codon:yes stop_codon:yes gene_type:complete